MIKIKKSVLNFIQKALNEQPKTLNYFKKEFINILKKQYDELDKKESKEKSFEKSIMLYAGDVFIEKGRAANIGEVREWKGRKFKKIAQGKWRPIYESASRGAKQSIKLLAKKISKVNSTDELMEIIMQNVNRFQDENGKILPIVEELKNAVNEKKQSLNAGKPTTKKVAPKTEENNEYTENYKPKSIEDWDSAYNGDKRSKDSDKVHNILDKNEKTIQEKLIKINSKKVDGKYINTKAINRSIKESSKLWKEYIGENEPDSLKEIKKLWEEESKKYFNEKYKEKAEKEIVEIPDEKLLSLKEEYEDLPTIDDCINWHNINEYCKGGYLSTLGMSNFTKSYVLKKHYLLPMIENEIKKRKLDSQEAPKTEEKAESSNSSESKDLSNNKFANLKEPIKPSFIKGKWNGKIYGDEKYGYRIYVDNNEFTLSKNEHEELHKYNIDHKEWETENLYKRLATSKISSKILKDLGTVIEQFNSYSEENLNKLKELKNKFQNTDLITGIKDKFYTNLLDDVKDGRLRQKGLSQLPQPSKDDVKAIIEIFKNDKAFRDEIKNRCLEKITNEINKLERQAKEIQEGKEYNERYNNDEEFRKKEREKNQKQADRIKEIAGEGYWNGKVYGSAKNGYSIYVKNKKYTIPESDYELFDLKKSFPERISEILKSLK